MIPYIRRGHALRHNVLFVIIQTSCVNMGCVLYLNLYCPTSKVFSALTCPDGLMVLADSYEVLSVVSSRWSPYCFQRSSFTFEFVVRILICCVFLFCRTRSSEGDPDEKRFGFSHAKCIYGSRAPSEAPSRPIPHPEGDEDLLEEERAQSHQRSVVP